MVRRRDGRVSLNASKNRPSLHATLFGRKNRFLLQIDNNKSRPHMDDSLIQILGNTSKGGQIEQTIPLSCQLTLCLENYFPVLSKLYGDKPPRGIRRIFR